MVHVFGDGSNDWSKFRGTKVNLRFKFFSTTQFDVVNFWITRPPSFMSLFCNPDDNVSLCSFATVRIIVLRIKMTMIAVMRTGTCRHACNGTGLLKCLW